MNWEKECEREEEREKVKEVMKNEEMNECGMGMKETYEKIKDTNNWEEEKMEKKVETTKGKGEGIKDGLGQKRREKIRHQMNIIGRGIERRRNRKLIWNEGEWKKTYRERKEKGEIVRLRKKKDL